MRCESPSAVLFFTRLSSLCIYSIKSLILANEVLPFFREKEDFSWFQNRDWRKFNGWIRICIRRQVELLGWPFLAALGLERAMHFPPWSPSFSSWNILFAMVSLLRCNNDMWEGRGRGGWWALCTLCCLVFFFFSFLLILHKVGFFGLKTHVFLIFYKLKKLQKFATKKLH